MVDNTEIDFVPTASLPNIYGINRAALYKRMEAAGVKPFKLDSRNKTYVNKEQLKLLDELDKHLKSGGILSEFNPSGTVKKMGVIPSQGTGLDLVNGNFPVSMQIVTELEKIAAALKPGSDIEALRQLQEITDNGWLITTNQVEGLIGVRPKGKDFVRGSFRFTKSGKIGTQSAWKVERISE